MESGFILGKNLQDIIFNSYSVTPYSLPTKLPFILVRVRPTIQLEETVLARNHLTSDINLKFRRVPKTTLRFDYFLEEVTEFTEAITFMMNVYYRERIKISHRKKSAGHIWGSTNAELLLSLPVVSGFVTFLVPMYNKTHRVLPIRKLT